MGLFYPNYSRTNHLQLRELTAIPSSAWHRAGRENTHEILSQDNQPGAQKLGLQMYRRSGARMGAGQGPQLPTSSPPRGAFLQGCTPEDSSGGSTGAAQPGIHCNPTLPWSLDTPFSPAPHGSPPTHTQTIKPPSEHTPSTPVHSGCTLGGFNLCCFMSCFLVKFAERNAPENAKRFNFNAAFCSPSIPIDLP